MNLDKMPRWALVAICGVFMSATLFFANRAVADSDRIKTVAYEARSTAQDALSLGNDLKLQIADVRGAQETFRREYREDQKDLDKKLGEILRVVKTT